MSGADPPGSENLKGLSRYFNSETNFGRANVSNLVLVYNLKLVEESQLVRVSFRLQKLRMLR